MQSYFLSRVVLSILAASAATQVNLEFNDAKPVLVEKLTKSLSGLL
jgi:hypothetical protein